MQVNQDLTGRDCATEKQMFLPQVGTIRCQSWTSNSNLIFQLVSGRVRRGTLASQPHADIKLEGPLKAAELGRVGWVRRGCKVAKCYPERNG